MTEKQLTAIEGEIADATSINQLDEISQTLFDEYFKNGKAAAVMKLHNAAVKKINKQAGFERNVIITKDTKPPRVINDEPGFKKAAVHGKKAEEDLFGDAPKAKSKKAVKPVADEDLFGDADEDLFGDAPKTKSKPGGKKVPDGKPNTGQRVKALVEKGKDKFADVVAVLTKEGYKFSENSVRWYISKAKKGEL